MGKEVEKLILENNELLATKNALNIVKDDLIVKVDELSGELEIMREEMMASTMHREKLRQKVMELEEELKKTKEQAKQQSNPDQEDEAEVPMAQRKRFTRVEMARVLMERNQVRSRRHFLFTSEINRISFRSSTRSASWSCKRRFAGPK